MTGAFTDYPTTPSTFDETVSGQGQVRPGYEQIAEQFQDFGLDDVRNRGEYVSKSYHDQGVTFDFEGEERPFPLDIVPRVIESETWAHVESGVAQRVRALEAFLADIYGPMEIVTDRVLPRHIVTTSSHYHRAAFDIQPGNGVRVHVSGIDLIRDAEGAFRVLEDNVRIPSGVSYVLTNRRAMTSTLPEVVGTHRIRPVAAYPSRLLRALRAAAPAGITDPEVVVLTPGPYNSAYFEHSLLARLMGCRLVEGRDLVTQGGRVMMRTTHGLQPVHVIYRRVDDDFLDPVAFRNDSVLGCPGVLNAARAGNVTIANAVGNGVADDKLMYSYVPDIIRYYLGEEPILPNVDTWRMEDPEHREEVLDRLGELVLKPVDGSGGKGIVIGPQASKDELEALREAVTASPRGWIAQPVVQLSTVPTMVEEGLRPRHVDLRPFAINDGEKVWVLPGGLTRVALGEGELIVNSSRGGGSKDTWVLSGDGRRTRVEPRPQRQVQIATAPQIALKRSGAEPAEEQQQQQQQQQQAPRPREDVVASRPGGVRC